MSSTFTQSQLLELTTMGETGHAISVGGLNLYSPQGAAGITALDGLWNNSSSLYGEMTENQQAAFVFDNLLGKVVSPNSAAVAWLESSTGNNPNQFVPYLANYVETSGTTAGQDALQNRLNAATYFTDNYSTLITTNSLATFQSTGTHYLSSSTLEQATNPNLTDSILTSQVLGSAASTSVPLNYIIDSQTYTAGNYGPTTPLSSTTNITFTVYDNNNSPIKNHVSPTTLTHTWLASSDTLNTNGGTGTLEIYANPNIAPAVNYAAVMPSPSHMQGVTTLEIHSPNFFSSSPLPSFPNSPVNFAGDTNFTTIILDKLAVNPNDFGAGYLGVNPNQDIILNSPTGSPSGNAMWFFMVFAPKVASVTFTNTYNFNIPVTDNSQMYNPMGFLPTGTSPTSFTLNQTFNNITLNTNTLTGDTTSPNGKITSFNNFYNNVQSSGNLPTGAVNNGVTSPGGVKTSPTRQGDILFNGFLGRTADPNMTTLTINHNVNNVLIEQNYNSVNDFLYLGAGTPTALADKALTTVTENLNFTNIAMKAKTDVGYNFFISDHSGFAYNSPITGATVGSDFGFYNYLNSPQNITPNNLNHIPVLTPTPYGPNLKTMDINVKLSNVNGLSIFDDYSKSTNVTLTTSPTSTGAATVNALDYVYLGDGSTINITGSDSLSISHIMDNSTNSTGIGLTVNANSFTGPDLTINVPHLQGGEFIFNGLGTSSPATTAAETLNVNTPLNAITPGILDKTFVSPILTQNATYSITGDLNAKNAINLNYAVGANGGSLTQYFLDSVKGGFPTVNFDHSTGNVFALDLSKLPATMDTFNFGGSANPITLTGALTFNNAGTGDTFNLTGSAAKATSVTGMSISENSHVSALTVSLDNANIGTLSISGASPINATIQSNGVSGVTNYISTLTINDGSTVTISGTGNFGSPAHTVTVSSAAAGAGLTINAAGLSGNLDTIIASASPVGTKFDTISGGTGSNTIVDHLLSASPTGIPTTAQLVIANFGTNDTIGFSAPAAGMTSTLVQNVLDTPPSTIPVTLAVAITNAVNAADAVVGAVATTDNAQWFNYGGNTYVANAYYNGAALVNQVVELTGTVNLGATGTNPLNYAFNASTQLAHA